MDELKDLTLNKRSHPVCTAGSHLHEILQQAKLISRVRIRSVVARGMGARRKLSEQAYERMFWDEGNVVYLDWDDGIHLSERTMNVFSCV